MPVAASASLADSPLAEHAAKLDELRAAAPSLNLTASALSAALAVGAGDASLDACVVHRLRLAVGPQHRTLLRLDGNGRRCLSLVLLPRRAVRPAVGCRCSARRGALCGTTSALSRLIVDRRRRPARARSSSSSTRARSLRPDTELVKLVLQCTRGAVVLRAVHRSSPLTLSSSRSTATPLPRVQGHLLAHQCLPGAGGARASCSAPLGAVALAASRLLAPRRRLVALGLLPDYLAAACRRRRLRHKRTRSPRRPRRPLHAARGAGRGCRGQSRRRSARSSLSSSPI